MIRSPSRRFADTHAQRGCGGRRGGASGCVADEREDEAEHLRDLVKTNEEREDGRGLLDYMRVAAFFSVVFASLRHFPGSAGMTRRGRTLMDLLMWVSSIYRGILEPQTWNHRLGTVWRIGAQERVRQVHLRC